MLNISKIYNSLYTYRQGFASSLSYIWGFLAVKIYLILALLLNILAWTLTILFKGRLSEDLIILHFNVDFGVDMIGKAERILLIPAIGLTFLFVNFILLFFFLKSDHFKFLAHILLAGALLANIFLLIALGPIYYINFR